MSAALITLFAVSALGALGMAFYGLRVLVSRWEQPRPPRVLSVPRLPPIPPMLPMQPAPPPAVPVWVPPAGTPPVPMAAPIGIATPPPMTLPSGGIPAMPPPGFVPPGFAPSPGFVPQMTAPLPSFTPPPPPIAGTPPARPALSRAPTWTPPTRAPSHRVTAPRVTPPRAPSPGQVSGSLAALHPRLARGSIPPDLTSDLDADLVDSDTDPSVPLDLERSEPVVQRGARYSVVRSSRR